MKIMVRYRVKPDLAGENERLIRAVFDELARAAPAGIRYQSYRLADGASFLHMASIDTADGANPLLALESFRRFTGTIRERCEEPPVTTELFEVGAYPVPDGATLG
jgi:hypothetical protein